MQPAMKLKQIMTPARSWQRPAAGHPDGGRGGGRVRQAVRQGGYVLATALLFLLVLTLLGVTALRTTSLEEKMAHNIKDKNLSFQAAESALAKVEYWLSTRQAYPLPNPTNGLYPQDYSGNAPAWQTVDWQGSSGLQVYPHMPDGTTLGTNLDFIYAQPRYLVEEVGISCGKSLKCGTSAGRRYINYRVTARASGGTGAAVSQLQTTYNRIN
jgi:type IV pilus assembly protein PilX